MISSCHLHAIKFQQLESSLGCVFHLFAVKLVMRHAHRGQGKSLATSPQSPASSDSLVKELSVIKRGN